MFAGPPQYPGVELCPAEAHRPTSMQLPATPFTWHGGGGVQHCSFAPPGQCPAVCT
jgi:hypothetical protein